jgi:hypothetical protein
VRAQVADRLAFEQDVAGVLRVEARDGAQQRGLAAAAGAEQREERAALGMSRLRSFRATCAP